MAPYLTLARKHVERRNKRRLSYGSVGRPQEYAHIFSLWRTEGPTTPGVVDEVLLGMHFSTRGMMMMMNEASSIARTR